MCARVLCLYVLTACQQLYLSEYEPPFLVDRHTPPLWSVFPPFPLNRFTTTTNTHNTNTYRSDMTALSGRAKGSKKSRQLKTFQVDLQYPEQPATNSSSSSASASGSSNKLTNNSPKPTGAPGTRVCCLCVSFSQYVVCLLCVCVMFAGVSDLSAHACGAAPALRHSVSPPTHLTIFEHSPSFSSHSFYTCVMSTLSPKSRWFLLPPKPTAAAAVARQVTQPDAWWCSDRGRSSSHATQLGGR